MAMSPMLWGAGLVCVVGGAVAGTALGSAPVLDRQPYGTYYQSHEPTASRLSDDRPAPDHYPLVTRQGVVPVEQLAQRGLFSQARYRATYDMADLGPGPQIVEADYDPDSDAARWAARDDAALPQEAAGEAAAPAAPAPLAPTTGPAALTAGGQAKTMDVQAVLALR